MKQLCNLFFILLFALNCVAQSFNVGMYARQFTNQDNTITYGNVQPWSTSSNTNNAHVVNAGLFVDKVSTNNMYYRITLGVNNQNNTNGSTENPPNPPIAGNNVSYSNESKVQTYNAAIGIGKIFSYQKISLRVGAEFYFTRYQTSTTNNTVGTTDSSGAIFTSQKSSSSSTPYNQYNLNYYAALHYNIWKDLSIGFQIDNGISYTLQKATQTVTTNYYSPSGALTNSTVQTNSIDNKSIATFFLRPSLSIFYNFKCASKTKAE